MKLNVFVPPSGERLYIFGIIEYVKEEPFEALWMVQVLRDKGYTSFFYNLADFSDLQPPLHTVEIEIETRGRSGTLVAEEIVRKLEGLKLLRRI